MTGSSPCHAKSEVAKFCRKYSYPDFEAERPLDVLDLVDDAFLRRLPHDVGHVDATLVDAEREHKLAPKLVLIRKERLKFSKA